MIGTVLSRTNCIYLTPKALEDLDEFTLGITATVWTIEEMLRMVS